MGKNKAKSFAQKQNKPQTGGKYLPFVSICTPTFNRRPFIPTMFKCFLNQTYPKDRMEWIIVDDGTDPIEDLIATSGISQIKYFRESKKMPLGEKRNYMHKKAKGSIIVYMDDDDYYPPERVAHAVETLMGNKEALCAGSSEMYLYFKHIGKMYQFGPYGPNHATAGTFAFKSRLLDDTKYDDAVALAEEKSFLKDYTVPFVQLDPLKTILVFSHNHNTFDKRKLLDVPSPFVKESDKTVDMFIRKGGESDVKRFFMEDIDALLENYAAGLPENKPDVMQQVKEVYDRLNQQKNQAQPTDGQLGYITMQINGGETVALSQAQVISLLQQQQAEIDRLRAEVERLSASAIK